VTLPSGRAAVDWVVGACDVRRSVRSDEGRELRDLLGLAEALEKRLSGYRAPGRLVAAEDLGAFAALAFERPDEWMGREVDLAGDEQTMPEIAGTFSRVTGREIHYSQAPWDQIEEQMGEELTIMWRWFNAVGYEADITALRQEYPKLTTFERYLRSHGWEGTGRVD
jgi:uncharacterized protein YbjT (DUF2867 family)